MNKFRFIAKASALLLAGASFTFALPKASDLVKSMGLGYNIGNTMEVPVSQGGPTGWGNSVPTAEYVKAIKAAGFNTVRIPCAWDSHASNGVIDEKWLETVKSVVDLVLDEGMYAILNSHWDGGWLEDHVFDGDGYDQTGAVKSAAADVEAKQTAYWKQIAETFKSYDEHLIFASANEPGVNDPWLAGVQWAFDEKRMQVLKLFHEACIKAVRATGGNNETRIIVVQAPRTEMDFASLLNSNMPTDPTGDGYIMAEVHYYPYQFSLMDKDEDWGKQFYYYTGFESDTDKEHNMGWNVYSNAIDDEALGTPKQVKKALGELKTMFCDKDIPVVIGEMGAIKRLNALKGEDLKRHLVGRAAWYGNVVTEAKANGIVPCVWDTGDEGNGNMTIIRRQVPKYAGKVGDIVDYETLNMMRIAYGMEAIEGNSVDALVEKSQQSGDMAFKAEYAAISDTSETGTISYKFSASDWSQYKGISFDLKFKGACTGYWSAVTFFNMSGNWDWKQVELGAIDDFNGSWQTVTVSFDGSTEPSVDFSDISKVVAIGINVQGEHVAATLELDNVVLLKKDGSKEVLIDFNGAEDFEAAGIASGSRVPSTAPNSSKDNQQENNNSNNNNKDDNPIVLSKIVSNMHVNVVRGGVNAVFNSVSAGNASVVLLNSMGQVIASRNFATRVGANEVQLNTAFRGNALLVVKQGSQRFVQKIVIK